jgi:hypothetical protein
VLDRGNGVWVADGAIKVQLPPAAFAPATSPLEHLRSDCGWNPASLFGITAAEDHRHPHLDGFLDVGLLVTSLSSAGTHVPHKSCRLSTLFGAEER